MASVRFLIAIQMGRVAEASLFARRSWMLSALPGPPIRASADTLLVSASSFLSMLSLKISARSFARL